MKNLIAQYVRPYLKAHVAGIGAGLSVLLADAGGNLSNLGNLTADQWLAAVVASGLLGSLTGFIANRPAPVAAPAPAAPTAPAANPQDDGSDAPTAA